MRNRRTFDEALKTNARVQLDYGRNVYHLFFACGTESYRANDNLLLKRMEDALYQNGYRLIYRQDAGGRILDFAHADSL